MAGVARRSPSLSGKQTYTRADARVAEFAAAREGVMSIRQLRNCGLNDKAVFVRVRQGWLHPIHRGVYAVGHPGISRRGRFRAAVLAGRRGTALARFAAAAEWGFMPWNERHPEIIVTRGGARRIPGVRVYRSRTLVRRDVQHRNGIPMTSPARTLLDLAAVLPEKALRRATRQAQAMRLVSVEEIREICDRLGSRHRGAGKLRRIVSGGPAPTRSPLEDIVLDLLDGAGIRRPLINAPLTCDGRTIIPDFLWPDLRLAIEADSVTWHEHKLVRENDADKQAILEAAGYRVLRITRDQATNHPRQTLARIREALAATS